MANRCSHFLRLIFVLGAFLVSGSALAQRETASGRPADLEKVAATYGIQIVTTDPGFPIMTTHGAINGKVADVRELPDYGGLFVREFSLYPRELVERSRLKRVVLCSDLSFARQRRSAIPDFEHHTLYLDVSGGSSNRLYQRKVIHHEFFHILDWVDDGSVYEDATWVRLNPPGFKYGSGGSRAQDNSGTSVLTEKYPGFLNHYSTTGVEEDKAEIFANLMADSDYVRRRISKDLVLRSKVEAMKALLSQFCPQMNEDFWQKVDRTESGDQP